MIALDLLPAIMSAGLSSYAQIVLSEVILQSYGARKSKTVYLPSVDIQEITGVDRCNVRRAVRELIDANILVESGGGYEINKDYESWTPKAGPLKERLEGRLLTWITHCPDRLGKLQNHVSTETRDVSTQTHKTSAPSVYPDTLNGDPTCLPRHMESAPPKNPLIGTHAELELRDERKDKTRQLSLLAGSKPEGEPEYPDPETSFITIHPGGANTTEDEARSIWSALWAQWHSVKLCRGFYEHQRWYSASTWRAAIRQVVRQGTIPNTIAYVEKIAADYAANGVPAELAPKHGEPGYIPPSQTVKVQYFQDPYLPAEVA